MPDALEQVTTRYGNVWLLLVVWRVKSRLPLRSHFWVPYTRALTAFGACRFRLILTM